MKLFFLRHGEAEANSNDDIRALTTQGRVDVARVAQQRIAALADVQQVFVSPLVRAQQTADIACREASIGLPRVTVDWLVHETPVREALAMLVKLDKNTLLVGHQPLAGSLVERLCDTRGAFIGTANLVEMDGEAFLAGLMQIVHQQMP